MNILYGFSIQMVCHDFIMLLHHQIKQMCEVLLLSGTGSGSWWIEISFWQHFPSVLRSCICKTRIVAASESGLIPNLSVMGYKIMRHFKVTSRKFFVIALGRVTLVMNHALDQIKYLDLVWAHTRCCHHNSTCHRLVPLRGHYCSSAKPNSEVGFI